MFHLGNRLMWINVHLFYLPNSPLKLKQYALGTRHLPFPSHDGTRRHPRRHGQRLERTLRPVMIVITPDTINVHRNTGSLRETLQTMWNHLAAQVADFLSLETDVDDAEGAVGEVDYASR